MNGFGPLFDEPDEASSGPPTWSVLEFNRAVEGALQNAFPGEFWIRGEIQGLARTRARRHWYFELVEKDPDGDAPLAKVSIALLNWKRAGVEREMRAAEGDELFEVELKKKSDLVVAIESGLVVRTLVVAERVLS